MGPPKLSFFLTMDSWGPKVVSLDAHMNLHKHIMMYPIKLLTITIYGPIPLMEQILQKVVELDSLLVGG